MAESVAAALEGRTRLLVFDNCEHVLDAAADMIGSILQHSATVTIVATSREGLRLADEQLWPVPSLEMRKASIRRRPTLFVERAGLLRRPFHCRDPARRSGGGDLSPTGWHPAGDRVGRIAHAVHDGHRTYGIGSMIGSGCWSDRGAGWSATKLCAMPCSGPIDLLDDVEKCVAGNVFGVRGRVRPRQAPAQ